MRELIRICPLCGKQNAVEETFCTCGTLLADVDFTHPDSLVAPTVPTAPLSVLSPTAAELVGLICPHSDCAQPNPAGSTRCVYCDREFVPPAPVDEQQFRLPPSLRPRYRLLSPMPSVGGQADVWLAENQAKQRCVVKLYRHGLEPDWQVLERLPSVDNPHVLRFFEHGVAEGVAFEVTEYCPEGDVRGLLEHWPLPDATLRALLAQLTTTLQALHAQHILHRDLKPDNLLLRSIEPLDIVLIDFGASSLKMATQYFTQGARTAHYAAPEVLTGVLDEKSDWWAVGMILLEAVSGRHPFAGLSEQIALHQLATQSVAVTGVIDEAWRMLCRGLLLRNPRKRWGAAEVQRWLAGDASLTMPEDSGDGTATRPYRLVKSECHTRSDLALALAKHWEEGKKDLRRGAVLNWVEHDLHDSNLAREIDDVRRRDDLSDDAKLLHVILRALPGMPPVWRGRVITQHTLLRAATQQNFPDALGWLASLYDEAVLSIPAEYGNTDLQQVADTWRSDLTHYQAQWERAKQAEDAYRQDPAHGLSGGTADVGYMLYLAPIRMNSPEPFQILPELVLVHYAPERTAAIRQAVRTEAVVIECGWLDAWLAEIAEEDAVAWYVAQRLLPFAKEDAERDALTQRQAIRNANTDVLGVLEKLEAGCQQFLLFEDVGDFTLTETRALYDEANAWIEQSIWLKGLEHQSTVLHHVSGQLDVLVSQLNGLRGFLSRHLAILEVNHIWLRADRIVFGLMLVAGTAALNGFSGGLLAVGLVAWWYWRWQRARDSSNEGLTRMRRVVNVMWQFKNLLVKVREIVQQAEKVKK